MAHEIMAVLFHHELLQNSMRKSGRMCTDAGPSSPIQIIITSKAIFAGETTAAGNGEAFPRQGVARNGSDQFSSKSTVPRPLKSVLVAESVSMNLAPERRRLWLASLAAHARAVTVKPIPNSIRYSVRESLLDTEYRSTPYLSAPA